MYTTSSSSFPRPNTQFSTYSIESIEVVNDPGNVVILDVGVVNVTLFRSSKLYCGNFASTCLLPPGNVRVVLLRSPERVMADAITVHSVDTRAAPTSAEQLRYMLFSAKLLWPAPTPMVGDPSNSSVVAA